MKKQKTTPISDIRYPKSAPLRLLIIEDSENDAKLLLKTLERGGLAVGHHRRVDDRVGLLGAIQSAEWDVIVCDYSMPGFGALEALEIYRGSDLDIPFIIASGTVGEDVAVECMRLGAQDYLMKDNLTRLAPAVERELKDAEIRYEGHKLESKTKEQLTELRRWQDVMLDREDRVQELKQEINELNRRLDEPIRYPSQVGRGGE